MSSRPTRKEHPRSKSPKKPSIQLPHPPKGLIPKRRERATSVETNILDSPSSSEPSSPRPLPPLPSPPSRPSLSSRGSNPPIRPARPSRSPPSSLDTPPSLSPRSISTISSFSSSSSSSSSSSPRSRSSLTSPSAPDLSSPPSTRFSSPPSPTRRSPVFSPSFRLISPSSTTTPLSLSPNPSRPSLPSSLPPPSRSSSSIFPPSRCSSSISPASNRLHSPVSRSSSSLSPSLSRCRSGSLSPSRRSLSRSPTSRSPSSSPPPRSSSRSPSSRSSPRFLSALSLRSSSASLSPTFASSPNPPASFSCSSSPPPSSPRPLPSTPSPPPSSLLPSSSSTPCPSPSSPSPSSSPSSPFRNKQKSLRLMRGNYPAKTHISSNAFIRQLRQSVNIEHSLLLEQLQEEGELGGEKGDDDDDNNNDDDDNNNDDDNNTTNSSIPAGLRPLDSIQKKRDSSSKYTPSKPPITPRTPSLPSPTPSPLPPPKNSPPPTPSPLPSPPPSPSSPRSSPLPPLPPPPPPPPPPPSSSTLPTAISLSISQPDDPSLSPFWFSLPGSADINYVVTQAIFHFSALKPEKDFSRYGLCIPNKIEWMDPTATLKNYFSPGETVELYFKQAPAGRFKSSPVDLINIMVLNLKNDPYGRAPVHLLASDPSVDGKFLNVLLKKKLIDVESQDRQGKTPLMYATEHHCYTAAVFFLQHTKGGLEAADLYGRTALHLLFLNTKQAAEDSGIYNEKECIALIGKMNERGVGYFSRDVEGNLPLHTAAKGGYTAALMYFVVEKNIHSNLRNYEGETILHNAILGGSLEVVKLCLRLGASRHSATYEKETPEQMAIRVNFPLSGVFSEPKSKKEEEMMTIIENNDLPALQQLFSEKTKKTLESRGKNTIFDVVLRCIRYCRPTLLKWLLTSLSLDLTTTTSDGSTLLHALSEASWREGEEGQEEGRGEGEGGETMEGVFDLIVDRGCNVNTKNLNGESPLHLAVLAENLRCVSRLISRGSFTNTVNRKGETELHYAVMTTNKQLTGQLLRAGCDPSIRSAHGETVKELANRCGLVEIFQVLENHTRETVRFNSKKRPDFTMNQQNIMKIVIEKAAIFPTSTATEKSVGLFLEIRHRMGDRQKNARTVTQVGTWEPKWKFPVKFIYKKGESFFRDLEFEIFDATESEESVDKLGIAHFMVDGSEKITKQYSIPLVGLSGKIGDLSFSVSFEGAPSDSRRSLLDEYSHYDIMEQVRTVKKKSGEKRLGRAMFSLGYRPFYPIIIVPGLASSALEAWYTEQGTWKRSRVWIDPMKIGQTAGMQKFSNVFSKKKKTELKKSRESKEEEEEEEEEGGKTRRKWLQLMMTAPNGYSDPPGVKVRAVEGLHGIDFLAESTIAKKASYVFGHVINALIDVGYDNINLQAASYDWRLPPSKLQKRDFYFTRLRDMIRTAKNINANKVVLMGHSMGCRCIQYFLSWCEVEDPGFISENVHAFLAIGPPFLGAPKALRAVLTGDCMGLEVFLTPEEAVIFSRSCGSSPWLYPVNEQQFPDVVSRVSGESQSKHFQPKSSKQLTQSYASASDGFMEKYYKTDPFYLLPNEEGKTAVLSPPPVSNLWVIMGVNLPTEVSYYYKVEKKTTKPGQDPKLILDNSADKFSNKKNGIVNPRGLQISGGMAFETRSTYQPTIRMNKSGDGTVPFCSLNYAHFWKKQALEEGIPLDVQVVEVEGAEHREMLMNEVVLKAIMEFTCQK